MKWLGANVAFSSAEDFVTGVSRLRNCGSLWDATYVDESFVGEPFYISMLFQLKDTHECTINVSQTNCQVFDCG
jgi:hypothetical protein